MGIFSLVHVADEIVEKWWCQHMIDFNLVVVLKYPVSSSRVKNPGLANLVIPGNGDMFTSLPC
jgi:hypothetical protein